jgi:hypothetical protein
VFLDQVIEVGFFRFGDVQRDRDAIPVQLEPPECLRCLCRSIR